MLFPNADTGVDLGQLGHLVSWNEPRPSLGLQRGLGLSNADALLSMVKVLAPGLIYTGCGEGWGSQSFFRATGCTPWLNLIDLKTELALFSCPCDRLPEG